MIRINENYLKLQASYLFSEIAKRANAFQATHPQREIIRLGIGDVTRPLPEACIKAFHRAVDEMADIKSFRGYGPEQGYDFLREKIAQVDFQNRGADICADEIFISDGAKCDTGNIQEILATDITVATRSTHGTTRSLPAWDRRVMRFRATWTSTVPCTSWETARTSRT